MLDLVYYTMMWRIAPERVRPHKDVMIDREPALGRDTAAPPS